MGANGRRLLDRLVAWSPVVLIASLAALTWWLDAQIQPAARNDGNARHDPDIVVGGLRGVSLGADGQPVQMLQAKSARHFPDDGVTEFGEPRLTLTQAGKPSFEIDSRTARVTGDRENVFFEGAVRAVRAAETTDGKTTGPVVVTSEYLHVLPKENVVQTDRPVTVEEPRGIIHATGLVLNDRDKTVKLRSNVRGTIQPGALAK